MAGRRLAVSVLLLCLCLWLLPGMAQPVCAADTMINPLRSCELTITYSGGGTGFSGLPVALYRVAGVDPSYRYTLAAPFASSGLVVNGLRTQGEWNVVRTTLEGLILAGQVAPLVTGTTDSAGQVTFHRVEPGLYLAVTQDASRDGWTYCFDSALISLPGRSDAGEWQYQVAVTAKSQALPPVQPDSEIELSLLKLWRGDTEDLRPKQVLIEIYKDGTLYQTVTLTASANWSYRWTAPDDGAAWMVTERDVPAGYTATVEARGNSFLVTNTAIPDTPTPPDPPDPPEDPEQPDPPTDPENPTEEPPKTGDTTNIMLYTVLMYLSGAVLILLGITGRKKSK